MKKALTWFQNIFDNKKNTNNNSDLMEKQLKKYTETYKLLGEYDKKSIEDPTILAQPGRLQIYTNKVQQSSNN